MASRGRRVPPKECLWQNPIGLPLFIYCFVFGVLEDLSHGLQRPPGSPEGMPLAEPHWAPSFFQIKFWTGI